MRIPKEELSAVGPHLYGKRFQEFLIARTGPQDSIVANSKTKKNFEHLETLLEKVTGKRRDELIDEYQQWQMEQERGEKLFLQSQQHIELDIDPHVDFAENFGEMQSQSESESESLSEAPLSDDDDDDDDDDDFEANTIVMRPMDWK